MWTLDDLYERYVAGDNDIADHLPVLRWLASTHPRVTEFGVRTGRSTVALLMGNPNVISYDIEPRPESWQFASVASGWRFVEGSSIHVTIDETDLLFIDTVHNYDHLTTELERHHGNVTSTIALHDTHVEGRRGGHNDGVGMRQAVAAFLEAHPEWRQIMDTSACNGLTILARLP